MARKRPTSLSRETGIQLSIPGLPTRPHGPTLAQQSQRSVADWDDILVQMARERHPFVGWWWGIRTTQQGHGAYCYLCDTLCSTWNQRWPIGKRAIDVMDAHRAGHWSDAMKWADRTV